MDKTVQVFEFLDLSETNEAERRFLAGMLYGGDACMFMNLPWSTQFPFTDQEEWQKVYGEPTTCTEVASADPVICNYLSGEESALTEGVSQTTHYSTPPAGVFIEPHIPVMSVSLSIPSSVPTATATQPAMTTMYQILPSMPPMSNVHSYMGPPLSQYMPPPQVFHSSEIPVNHEPNSVSGRNVSQRDFVPSCVLRGRSSKYGSKRLDNQYGRNSTSHTSESQLVDYPQLFSMSPMHRPYGQPTYFTGAQALSQTPLQTSHHPLPHQPHHSPAQHAAGQPIYMGPMPMYPSPLYSPYPSHHQPAAATIMYSNTGSLPVASIPSTDTSAIGGYIIERTKSNDLEENKEPDDHHSLQTGSVLYKNEVNTKVLQHPINAGDKVNVNEDNLKLSNYQHQQSEEEDYNQTHLVSTVVVNNSKIIIEPSPFNKEPCKNGLAPTNNFAMKEQIYTAVVEHSVLKNTLTKDANKMHSNVLKMHTSDVNTDVNIIVNGMKNNSCSVDKKGKSLHTPEISCGETLVPSTETIKTVVPPTKATITNIANTELAEDKPATSLVPVQHQSSGRKNDIVPSLKESTSLLPTNTAATARVTASVTAPRSKSYASLFQKNSGGPRNCTSDSSWVGSVGTPSTKPLAVVQPFQSSGLVTPVQESRCNVDGPRNLPLKILNVRKTNEVTSNLSQLPPPTLADDPNLNILAEHLSKYQLEHKACSLQPRGLTNRSNWCYINSTLQALLACPPFYNLMKALPLPVRRHWKSPIPIIDSMVQFVNEFMPLSSVTRMGRKEKAIRKDDGTLEVQSGAPFEPNYIYKMLNNIRSDTFKVEGRQEDAEEFLSCLINGLNDEMLEVMKLRDGISVVSNLSNGDSTTCTADEDLATNLIDEWKVMGPKNKGSITHRTDFGKTPISDIFRGQQRSRVQRAGDQSTDNVQPFFTLQLDIEKAQSVKDALEILVGKDQLEGVTCSRTNQEIEAWQQVTLEELPLVLVLHLKWFDYKQDGCSKIFKTVEFPIDLKLDGKLMSSNRKYSVKQKQYKLFAVVYHDGKEATKGHYITDVFHVGYGGWVRYDDSSVKAVQESQVLRPRVPRVPYLLYYRRCDTIGPIVNNVASERGTPDKIR